MSLAIIAKAYREYGRQAGTQAGQGRAGEGIALRAADKHGMNDNCFDTDRRKGRNGLWGQLSKAASAAAAAKCRCRWNSQVRINRHTHTHAG